MRISKMNRLARLNLTFMVPPSGIAKVVMTNNKRSSYKIALRFYRTRLCRYFKTYALRKTYLGHLDLGHFVLFRISIFIFYSLIVSM